LKLALLAAMKVWEQTWFPKHVLVLEKNLSSAALLKNERKAT
jgi:hypothetical protein